MTSHAFPLKNIPIFPGYNPLDNNLELNVIMAEISNHSNITGYFFDLLPSLEKKEKKCIQLNKVKVHSSDKAFQWESGMLFKCYWLLYFPMALSKIIIAPQMFPSGQWDVQVLGQKLRLWAIVHKATVTHCVLAESSLFPSQNFLGVWFIRSAVNLSPLANCAWFMRMTR